MKYSFLQMRRLISMILILMNLLASAASYASSHSLMAEGMSNGMDVVVALEVSTNVTDCHETDIPHFVTSKKVLDMPLDATNSNCGEQQCECPDSLCHVFSSAAIDNHFTGISISSSLGSLYDRQHNNHFFELLSRPPKS